MGVPILRLPVVALKVLLDHFNGVELVIVSLLSKRAERIMTGCGKSNVSFFNLEESEIEDFPKLKMTQLFLLEVARRGFPWPAEVLVSISDNPYVSINRKESSEDFVPFTESIYVESLKRKNGTRKRLLIGDNNVLAKVVKDEESGDLVHTLWDTRVLGLTTLLKYFHQELNLPFNCLSIEGGNRSKDFSKTIREFVSHINSSGITPEDIETSDELSDEDFNFLLENVSVTGTFKSSTEASKNFKFAGKIQAESISIKIGHWFTIENLMASVDNKEIVILGSKLTHAEVRSFLESWKFGHFPNLRKVRLETNKPDAFLVTDGFERRSLYVHGEGMPNALSRGLVGYGNAYGVVTKQVRSNMFEMSVRFNE